MSRYKQDPFVVQREQVEWVFGLTGGELASETWIVKAEAYDTGFAYWYEGVPEWATNDFDPDATYRTALYLDTHGSIYSLLVDDQGTWELEESFTNSGETECPGQHEDSRKVCRAQCALVKRWKRGVTAQCPLCESRIGEEHGFIYVGESLEAVYRLRDDSESDDTRGL